MNEDNAEPCPLSRRARAWIVAHEKADHDYDYFGWWMTMRALGRLDGTGDLSLKQVARSFNALQVRPLPLSSVED